MNIDQLLQLSWRS